MKVERMEPGRGEMERVCEKEKGRDVRGDEKRSLNLARRMHKSGELKQVTIIFASFLPAAPTSTPHTSLPLCFSSLKTTVTTHTSILPSETTVTTHSSILPFTSQMTVTHTSIFLPSFPLPPRRP
ncbi:hypothetical protein Pcinc_023709 [Petrolisthes cinctipes]|uniref:Uncharacterized protein n=1 Tax=Petrolisthes cinctipes TaxID=88211 RepID=A0AAE1KET5_PETCI|nr:hypothetical protein Pcinc_023709 [Petrolisthes cinctipes]